MQLSIENLRCKKHTIYKRCSFKCITYTPYEFLYVLFLIWAVLRA